MLFNIIEESDLDDGVKQYLISIKPENQIFLGYILEGFEGFCNYSTIKKDKTYMQVDISPFFIQEMNEILISLQKIEL